jgi:hypothetical protein
LLEHLVLVLPSLDPTPEQHLAVARIFGTPEPPEDDNPPHPDHPEICVFDSRGGYKADKHGIGHDQLLAKLRGIGPSADLALRIAIARWWALDEGPVKMSAALMARQPRRRCRDKRRAVSVV